MKLIQKLKNLFASIATAAPESKSPQPEPAPLPDFFFATVKDIQREDRNGTKGYLLLLTAHNVPHLVPAFLLDLKQFRNDSNIEFDQIKTGDTIRTVAIGGHFENFVPHSILGRIEICPPETDITNQLPVHLGYQSYHPAVPKPSFE